MKGIGKILLYVFAVLAFIGLVWVAFSPNSAGSDIDFAEWMNKPLTSYMIFVTIIAFVITLVLFAIYKVVDLMKHPSHFRETLYITAAIVIAAVIGLIFSDGDAVIYGNGSVYEGGMASKLIGTGIVATGVLLVVAFGFLIYDTVKGIIKG